MWDIYRIINNMSLLWAVDIMIHAYIGTEFLILEVSTRSDKPYQRI